MYEIHKYQLYIIPFIQLQEDCDCIVCNIFHTQLQEDGTCIYPFHTAANKRLKCLKVMQPLQLFISPIVQSPTVFKGLYTVAEFRPKTIQNPLQNQNFL